LAKSTPILINFFTDGLPLCGAPATTPWHYDAVEERPSTPSWMGSAHFLTKTLEKVRTEMSLHVLAYNMKRMIRIFGVGPLLEAMRA
jgi:hypothetical protein